MAGERECMHELRNDTAINVAGLLKGQTGQSRQYELWLDAFRLDDDLTAREVAGAIRLTRLRDGVMADVRAEGAAELICARCLRAYLQPFAVDFAEEYRQTVDVRTGIDVELPDTADDDTARIDDNHLLDLGEVLRQEILLALPMRPDCGESCPGPDSIVAADTQDQVVDHRLAALARLLDDDQAG